MRQHVPLSHAFPLPAPTRFQACVVIIAFWVHVCVCVRVWLTFRLAPCVPPNLQLLQFGLGCVPIPFRFPWAPFFAGCFCFYMGCNVCMYISVPAFYRHTCVCVRVRQLLSPGRKRGSLSPPLSLSWGNSILIFMVFF